MAITPPTNEDLAEIAGRYRLGLGASDVEAFRGIITGALASYAEVERLYQAHLPELPDRPYRWPSPAENELGAWYVTTELRTSGDGPLAGRRVAIKDNIEVAGLPMMNGSATLEGFVPRRDATVVTRLLDAGATITGKAVCEDLCFSGGSHTSRTGPVLNPWDRGRSAGGSSSGSAALVAAGHADMALGGDQGGSVRIPSAFCGTVGHKPTHGLVPYTGAFPIENTIDHLGPITRTVQDAALLLEVLAGRDGLDPRQRAEHLPGDFRTGLEAGAAGLRIAVVAEGFGIPGLSQPGVDEAVRAAIRTLEAAGASVNGYGMNAPGLYDPELIGHYAHGRAAHGAQMSESLKLTMLCGRYVIDSDGGRHYAMARNLALELTAAYDAALADADVLVLPTLPIVASPLPGPGAGREEKLARSLEMIANTAPFDVTGHPATSVPAGLADGLPAGLMIVGRRLEDGLCLRVARAYENAVGGFPAPPG